MAIAKIEPTSCCERYGLVQVRLKMYLEEGDARWNDPRFHVTDWNSKKAQKGYSGKIDAEGYPLDWEAYNAWVKSLPKIWLPERPFHNHMVYFDPYTLRDEDIETAINRHLPNFYKAWIDEWDKVKGGMRHGWDIETRRPRPPRYNLLQPELYVQRKLDCLAKVEILKTSSFVIRSTKIGKDDFPTTAIDVGSPAINRAAHVYLWALTVYRTQIDYNNPSNDTGALDTVEIYCNDYDLDNIIKFGTFTDNGSDNFTCHDAQQYGEITSGGLVSCTGLDIDINTGEYIGADARAAELIRIDSSVTTPGGGSGWYWISGQYCDPSDSGTFTRGSSFGYISMYGTGETEAPPGWTGKISGVTNPAKIMGVDVANIAKVKGVA